VMEKGLAEIRTRQSVGEWWLACLIRGAKGLCGGTYLVTVAPREVAGADVLEGVLDALLEGGHVRPVLPMLVPEVVGVGAGEDEAGGDAAVRGCAVSSVRAGVVCAVVR
jgi:hypothetical protein